MEGFTFQIRCIKTTKLNNLRELFFSLEFSLSYLPISLKIVVRRITDNQVLNASRSECR